MAYFAIGSATLFVVFYLGYLLQTLDGADIGSFAVGLLVWKAAVEIGV